MYVDNGGSAFPSPGIVFANDSQQGAYEDMPLRGYFAGQGLTGLLADLPETMYGLNWQENAAEGAYTIADAMLLERAK